MTKTEHKGSILFLPTCGNCGKTIEGTIDCKIEPIRMFQDGCLAREYVFTPSVCPHCKMIITSIYAPDGLPFSGY